MNAGTDELLSELEWASNRRKSRAFGKKVEINTDGSFSISFEDALTPTELENLEKYRTRWPGCAYMLGQNADVKAMRSTPSVLQTIIRNVGILWSDVHNRWLTPSEVLQCQGFPMTTELSCGVACCSFPKERAPFPGRKRAAMLEQSGNSMTTVVAGLCCAFALLHVPKVSGGYVARTANALKRARRSSLSLDFTGQADRAET